jgi:hypothetical protein
MTSSLHDERSLAVDFKFEPSIVVVPLLLFNASIDQNKELSLIQHHLLKVQRGLDL